ncbi:MAG: hypothetical protein ABIH65_02670 [Nanoarchaeota archaeon]
MAFPIEKILTVRARDYIETKGGKLYEMVGVHVELGYSEPSLLKAFSEKVPKNAEIVVDYNPNGTDASSATFFRMASGTALIRIKDKDA